MIGRTLLIVVCAFGVLTTAAHAGTPSSANGIGMLIPDDSGRSRGMGGAGIAVDDGKNLIQGNPALISSFKDASYGIGVTYDRVSTNPSTGAKTNFARTEPTIIRFVLPLYRGIALGWGLTPYSRTDVKLELPSPDGATYTDTMNSTGGINLSSFQLAASFLSFRAGAAVNYYFGEIKEEWIRDFKGAEDINNSTEYIKKRYRGYGATVGVLAKFSNISLGAGYTTQSSLDETKFMQPSGESMADIPLQNDTLRLPSTIRLGAAMNISKRLSAALDYSRSGWSDAARTDREKMMYEDTWAIGGGIRFTPSVSSIASYTSGIPMSIGFRYGTMYYKSFPKIDTVREASLTLGIELPFVNKSGGLITSYEIGKRGDADSNGWDETFFRVGVSLAGTIK